MPNYSDSSYETKKANQFARSLRGHFLISQALVIATKELETAPAPHTDLSNIADMQYLIDYVYPLFKVVDESKFQAMMEKLND